MHGFGFDSLHDEICVTSPLAQAYLSFRGGANGEEPPLRVIQCPHTQIKGTAYGANDKVSVDPVNNEIYLPIDSGAVLVFDRSANGDVAPKTQAERTRHPDTWRPVGGRRSYPQYSGRQQRRLDAAVRPDGERKYQAHSRDRRPEKRHGEYQFFQIYAPKGWIIAGGQGGFVGAWSVEDKGDVPPRWKIPVQQLTGYVASGIALDPAHKEVSMSAAGQRIRPTRGIMNSVITFSWPEIFN